MRSSGLWTGLSRETSTRATTPSFVSGSPKAAQSQTSGVNTEIAVTSTPAGAEIELDGAFVGNTPSTVGVSAGDHVIGIAKKGYKPWERKIKVTTGKIDIAAELETAN
jgi:PEGA domain